MKYIVLFFIFLFTFLDASTYIRTIRLASYKTQTRAQEALQEAQKFLYADKEMQKYQEEYKFKFRIIPIHDYYSLSLEPITDRVVLQKLLDRLRQRYKSAYPKKLHEIPKEYVKPEKIQKKVLEQKVIPQPVEEKIIIQREKPVVKKEISKLSKQGVSNEQKESKALSYAFVDNKFMILAMLALLVIVGTLGVIIVLLKRKNSQLQKKAEMALFELKNEKRTLQEKDKILSHVSHELRNPIASILGLSQLILENDLPVFQKENVQNIEHSALKTLEIIDDILNISKINAGELRIENKEFNINHMLEDVLNTTFLQAKHNNVEVILDVDDNVPSRIISDSLRLGQVLINLVSNAIKFSKHGTVYLKIRKIETRIQSILMEFSVVDDGIGMTQEQLEKIFNSYAQAENSTSREFGGTGLGLAISKELIEMMGGKIKVRSQKNVGTTFVFTIEARVFDIDNKRNYHLPSKEYLNKNVLIVENSNKNVIALLRAFRYFNYKTDTVTSLDEYTTQDIAKYDIVIVNQTQINKKSIETLQKLQLHKKIKTKLILTTYRFTKIDDKIIEKIDISGYLKIPFTQQNVLDTLVEMYGISGLPFDQNISDTKKKLKEVSLKKIIIAEDNIVNHKVLSGLLAKTGAEITFVTNGKELVNLLKKDNQYNLIFMDLEMPIMDGYAAAKEIRKNTDNDKLPIVALSARDDAKSKQKAFRVGMQGYLTKPISLDNFYRTIYDVLSGEMKIERDDSLQQMDVEEDLEDFQELGKFEGEEEFYKTLLEDFKTLYAKSAFQLSNFIKTQNYKDAVILAKDLKEVSLNIGAYSLCESVATLEYELIREENTKVMKAFENFEGHLYKLLTEIDRYLDKK